MKDDEKMMAARETFDTLCKMFDEIGYRYEKQEESLSVMCMVRGDMIPLAYHISVDSKRGLVTSICKLPANVTDDRKRDDMAVAISAVNYQLANGSFDYDMENGVICFRMAMSYRNSRLSIESMQYILFCAVKSVDEYCLDLTLLAKGKCTLEEFLKQIN